MLALAERVPCRADLTNQGDRHAATVVKRRRSCVWARPADRVVRPRAALNCPQVCGSFVDSIARFRVIANIGSGKSRIRHSTLDNVTWLRVVTNVCPR